MISIYCGGLTGRIYATSSRPKVLATHDDGTATFVLRAGAKKEDVTVETISAVSEHMKMCVDESCACTGLFGRRRWCGVIEPVPRPGEYVAHCILRVGHAGPHDFDVEEANVNARRLADLSN